MTKQNEYSVRESTLEVGGKPYAYYRLAGLEEQGLGKISKLPFSIKVLLEAAVRQFDGRAHHGRACQATCDLGRRPRRQRNSVHPGAYRSSRFHGRSGCCRFGSDARHG